MRILEVVFKPGDVAKMHHHPEHVVYALKGGKGRFTSVGKTQDMDIKAGSVIFIEAQDHEVKNIGTTTLDLIVMELKKQFSDLLFALPAELGRAHSCLKSKVFSE